jgi:hypothetical protein
MAEGASVVPQMVMPSHGRKNSTLPSRVLGTMRPMLRTWATTREWREWKRKQPAPPRDTRTVLTCQG